MSRRPNDYFSFKENVLLISIFVAIYISLHTNEAVFVYSWIFCILILFNIRRIKSRKIPIYFLRISGYFLPFAFVFIWLRDILPTKTQHVTFSFALSVVVSVTYLFLHRKQLYVSLSKESIAYNPRRFPKGVYLILIYNQIGAAICEELYFRGILISLFHQFGIFAVLLSATYFVLSHFILPWSESLTWRDYLSQFLIGLVSGGIFYYSGSLVFSIGIHIVVNTPKAYLMARLYHRDYINPECYRNLKSNDSLDDLDI